MKFFKATLLALFAARSALAAPATEEDVGRVSYDGFKVYRIWTHGRPADIRSKLDSGLASYERWNDDGLYHIDILVSPSEVSAFEALHLEHKILHEDLGASVQGESAGISKRLNVRDDEDWFASYHNYTDHVAYFNDLQKRFPDNSEIVSSGKSYEGRDIFGIHLYGKAGPGKPAVLYHGTVHAREWIAAPVVEYITLQLINGYSKNDTIVTTALDKYDFWIFPFVNPDGFVYSQTSDRLWRKNRQPAPPNATNPSCYGRDINRNWEFGWDTNPRGASTNPCSQTYRGEAPSDTPENKGLDKLVRRLRDASGIKLFIDWHSYGQYILSPFGNKETLYAPELGKWTKAASVVSEAIRDSSPNRTTYTFGPSGAVLYATTGAAPDHVYSIGGADFSYTVELRDLGDYGFVLPPELILPTAKEQWAGQRELLPILDEEFFDGVGQVY
ncbi:unnamed protein product [Clonostachys solani]|uniref:Peptidase M14 domain-containing protein n=1 Tax=Clonostachys solani TaxID=160281 RepID=A0A9N9Z7G3_9HYPO|nr:unnamed protein product [Clonostachys solani]